METAIAGWERVVLHQVVLVVHLPSPLPVRLMRGGESGPGPQEAVDDNQEDQETQAA
jgi:hypothetical protein